LQGVILVGALAWTGCRDGGDQHADRTPPEPASGEELRFAVSAMLSPTTTFDAYDALLGHIASELGRPYRMVQRRTYEEVNNLLLAGDVDLAFICSGALTAFAPDAPIELIAAPVVHGETTYKSVVVVRSDSSYRSFADLRGGRFAFTDVLSNTGHLYPTFRLHELGTTAEAFFSAVTLTGAHDRSVLAVHRKLVDAAAVDILIYDQLLEMEPSYAEQLRVIETSPPFAIPPVVAPTSVPAPLRKRLGAILVALSKDPAHRELLAPLGFDGFTRIDPSAYEPIRRMHDAVRR